MMFPSSRLLPLTIAAIVAVIAVKSTALVRFAPTMSALRSGTAQALLAAGDTATTSVIGRANAAVVDAPPAAPPRPPARTERPAAAVAPPIPTPTGTPIAGPIMAPDASTASSDPLKLRRSQLEERERQVVQRETLLSATDKRLAERIAELVALQARLQALDSGLKQRDEANWAGLVKLYEGMRPHEAAAIFNALEKPVLLEILDRMKPAKAAPVIAAMEAEKARQVTADLAARRTHAVTAAN